MAKDQKGSVYELERKATGSVQMTAGPEKDSVIGVSRKEIIAVFLLLIITNIFVSPMVHTR